MHDLRRLRHALRISQIRLAKISGVSVRYVQQAEEGLRALSSDEEFRILKALRKGSQSLQRYLGETFGEQQQVRGRT